MTSPLAILVAAAAQPAHVDADTFAKLCARDDAQRFTLDGAVQGVCVDGVAYHLELASSDTALGRTQRALLAGERHCPCCAAIPCACLD